MQRLTSCALVLAAAVGLTACADTGPRAYPYDPYAGAVPTYPAPSMAVEYGRVNRIETLYGRAQGQTSGGGAILGAVVGGLIGSQIGGGTGRAAATAVGVLGGAVAGNAIEGRHGGADTVQGYRITVDLDQGGLRMYDVPSPGDLRPGDRVRLQGGQIARY